MSQLEAFPIPGVHSHAHVFIILSLLSRQSSLSVNKLLATFQNLDYRFPELLRVSSSTRAELDTPISGFQKQNNKCLVGVPLLWKQDFLLLALCAYICGSLRGKSACQN